MRAWQCWSDDGAIGGHEARGDGRVVAAPLHARLDSPLSCCADLLQPLRFPREPGAAAVAGTAPYDNAGFGDFSGQGRACD